MILTVLIALSYQIVICFTFPDMREERYLWGPYTFMLFCVIWSMVLIFEALTAEIKADLLRKRFRRIGGIAAVILLIAMEWRMMDGGAQIAYLFHPDKEIEVLQEHKEIPWIVYGPTLGVYSYYDWLIPEKICFMSQYDTPEDLKAFEDFEDRDRFVVYLHEGYLEQFIGLVEQEFSAEYESRFLTNSTELKVYLINRVE